MTGSATACYGYDLLGADFGSGRGGINWYACYDRLLELRKDALFAHLVGRWRDLFNASFRCAAR